MARIKGTSVIAGAFFDATCLGRKKPRKRRGFFWACPLSKLFAHGDELEVFFSNLEIVVADLFKAAALVETDCSLVAVKHGKPHVIEVQFLGLLQQSILQSKSNFHGQKISQNVDFLELTNVL